MSQSTFTAGVIIIAFLLFLAAKDRLKVYGNALFGPSPSDNSGAGSGGGGIADTINTGVKIAEAGAALGL